MLAACRAGTEAAGVNYAQLVYPFVEKEVNLATPLAIERMCDLSHVSRAGYYRWRNAGYGWRRVTAQLRRQGWVANHKRVRRIMREDNLLCLRQRKFVVTTDSNHNRKVYPNLAKEMTVAGVNQLWIADITYIRLETEFVYLAVVLDAFSRRVIGWALDRTLEAGLTIRALRMALEQRKPGAGVVHHSDRVYSTPAGTTSSC